MDLYEKVRQFVIESFTKDGEVNHAVKHLERTVYWLLQICPTADLAMKIAAISHDIERSVRDYAIMDNILKNSDDAFKSEEFLRYHQEIGAKTIGDFLKKENAPEELIEKVRSLVLHHEVGGTEEENMIKDADSLSFFEVNADNFIANNLAKTSREKVLNKFNWMYKRVTSDQAKELAKPWYEAGVEKIKQSTKN